MERDKKNKTMKTSGSLKKNKGWWFLLTGLFLFVSCEEDLILTGEEVSYAADIRPLIDQNCTASGCHGAGSLEFELLTYNQVKLEAADIRQLIWVEQDAPHYSVALSDADREKFKDWVDGGALNN